MTSPTKPRSRKPESWNPLVLEVILLGITEEVLVPFETPEKVKEFRKVLNEVRRSFREHGHEKADEVDALRAIEVLSDKIMAERPSYQVDPVMFPYTVIISPALGFVPNINAAVSIRRPDAPPSTPTIDLTMAELERELAQVRQEQQTNDTDGSEAADFLRSRRRHD